MMFNSNNMGYMNNQSYTPYNQFSGIQSMQSMYGNSNTSNNLIRVNGIEGAKAYQMNPNSTVALFDNNSDLMYIKTSDGAGFSTVRTFTFNELLENTTPNKTQIDTNSFISREEFEQFKKEVIENGKQSIRKSTKQSDE